MVDHRALDRVERAVRCGDAFDGADRLAVQLRQKEDAGVKRLIIYTALASFAPARDHHGACPAIALVAAFFGARQAAIFAQPIQNCLCGTRGVQTNRFSVQKKLDFHMLALPPSVACGHPAAHPMRRKTGRDRLERKQAGGDFASVLLGSGGDAGVRKP